MNSFQTLRYRSQLQLAIYNQFHHKKDKDVKGVKDTKESSKDKSDEEKKFFPRSNFQKKNEKIKK